MSGTSIIAQIFIPLIRDLGTYCIEGNGGLCEPVNLRKLTRAFAADIHKQWM